MNTEFDFMLMALQQAQLGLGQCAPNPAVGAVVVRDGEIIATGYHHGPGQPHAEVEALRHVDDARDCELYVTLEPCCHYGRTPPCAELIIERQLQKVYFGYLDPNPVVAGKGQQLLQQAGIACDYLPTDDVSKFYQAYAYWWQHQRPWVTTKLAISDHHEAAIETLTNHQCQQYTHQQRLTHDAILTTVTTIIHDDPLYNARLIDATIKKPLYVLDRELRFPTNAAVLTSCNPIVVFYHQASQSRVQQLTQLGIECRQVSANPQLNLDECLASIAADGRHRLWVEAGPTCFKGFLQAGLAHEILIYIAAHRSDVVTQPFEFCYEPGQPRDIQFLPMNDNIIVSIT